MKKILTFLLLFVTFWTFAQDQKPTDTATFKPVQSPFFFYNLPDSSVWVNKGQIYGWTKLDNARDPWYIKMLMGTDTVILPIHKKDTLRLPVYKLKGDSITLKGYVTGWKMKHSIDSIMGLVYTRLYLDSVFKTKQDTLHNPVVQADSTMLYITPYKLLQSLPVGYEYEIVTAGVTMLTLPFTLSDRTLIFYNGSVLSKNLWSGVGTANITLMIDTKQKDLLKIQNQ